MGRGTRLLALSFSLLLAAGLAACGGGGGGGGGGPTQPTPGITFSPGSSTSTGITLAQGAATSSSLLVLEVRASQVQSLYGVAFDLQYPAGLLDFQAFRQGQFLASGGAAVSVQVFESSPGNLVVGLSRLGGVGGVDGSGVLLEMELTPVGSGTGAFSFARNAAYRADGTELAMNWTAGSVSVVR